MDITVIKAAAERLVKSAAKKGKHRPATDAEASPTSLKWQILGSAGVVSGLLGSRLLGLYLMNKRHQEREQQTAAIREAMDRERERQNQEPEPLFPMAPDSSL